jgi:hypothetical protein
MVWVLYSAVSGGALTALPFQGGKHSVIDLSQGVALGWKLHWPFGPKIG